jgi:translation initiation factor IF-2
MQQRRPRLGDILDDYCPRERRVTNHVVVAMIEEQVKQTRCSTCDAEHEFKDAKVPAPRRKRSDAPGSEPAALRPRAVSEETEPMDDIAAADETSPDAVPVVDGFEPPAADVSPDPDADAGGDALSASGKDDDGPVHRRLIRATLPRQDGQVPERKEPDFTMRQPGTRGGAREFDGNKPGRFGGGRRPVRADGGGAAQRFGGPRQGQGAGGPRTGGGQGRPGGGNRPGGQPGAPRGNRPPGPGGAGRGGGGRKRGR